MKKEVLTAVLLCASLSFAQYNEEGDNAIQSSETAEFTSQEAIQETSSPNTYTTEIYTASKADENNPYYHAHRGFYFSVNTGVAYTYIRQTYSNTTYSSHQESINVENKNFSGILSYDEFRLGASIANTASIYAALGFGVGLGTFEEYDENIGYEPNSGSFKEKSDQSYRFLFALGTEFYPIQNQDNPIYGLFLGLGFGIAVDLVNVTDHYYDETYKNKTTSDFACLFFRFEVGKDWWFSKRWSFGVALNYTFGYMNVKNGSGLDYLGKHYPDKETNLIHNIGLNIRISH